MTRFRRPQQSTDIPDASDAAGYYGAAAEVRTTLLRAGKRRSKAPTAAAVEIAMAVGGITGTTASPKSARDRNNAAARLLRLRKQRRRQTIGAAVNQIMQTAAAAVKDVYKVDDIDEEVARRRAQAQAAAAAGAANAAASAVEDAGVGESNEYGEFALSAYVLARDTVAAINESFHCNKGRGRHATASSEGPAANRAAANHGADDDEQQQQQPGNGSAAKRLRERNSVRDARIGGFLERIFQLARAAAVDTQLVQAGTDVSASTDEMLAEHDGMADYARLVVIVWNASCRAIGARDASFHYLKGTPRTAQDYADHCDTV